MADEPTKPEKVKKVTVTNEDILKAVGGMSDAVLQLVETLKKPDPAPAIKGREFTVTTTGLVRPGPTSPSTNFPVPIEWRELVDSTLNKQFGVEVSPDGDTASFGFSIIVPEKYSNAGKPHWETYHEDRRTRVISHALGLNGVREWTTKVYENFDPETKSRIAFDRDSQV